jgi:hypothetical protein
MEGRSRLFQLINQHSTLFEVVTGAAPQANGGRSAGTKRKEQSSAAQPMVGGGAALLARACSCGACAGRRVGVEGAYWTPGVTLPRGPGGPCPPPPPHHHTRQPAGYTGAATAAGARTPSHNTRQLSAQDANQGLVGRMAEVRGATLRHALASTHPLAGGLAGIGRGCDAFDPAAMRAPFGLFDPPQPLATTTPPHTHAPNQPPHHAAVLA